MPKVDNKQSHSTGLNEATTADLRRHLLRVLGRRTRDPMLADDLAQEALERVVRGLPQLRGTAALRTWASRIAVNVWHDHLRRSAASPVARAAAGEAFSVTALLDAVGPHLPAGPEQIHDQRATHDCLLERVRRLPLAERRTILLCDFGDMPLEEAAAALACSPGTAKVRLHRARRRLAELCREECVNDAGIDGATLCTPKRATALAQQAPPMPRRQRRK